MADRSNPELRATIKRNKEVWSALTKALRILESQVNLAHKYASRVNSKGGYISANNALTLGDKLHPIEEAYNAMRFSFNAASEVLGASGIIKDLMNKVFK